MSVLRERVGSTFKCSLRVTKDNVIGLLVSSLSFIRLGLLHMQAQADVSNQKAIVYRRADSIRTFVLTPVRITLFSNRR